MSTIHEMIKGHKYTWGKLVKIHEIGEYKVVEYFSYKYENNHRTDGYEETASFHPYINDQDTNNSYESLDAALVGVIAYKQDGPNSQAARFFMKMIS